MANFSLPGEVGTLERSTLKRSSLFECAVACAQGAVAITPESGKLSSFSFEFFSIVRKINGEGEIEVGRD